MRDKAAAYKVPGIDPEPRALIFPAHRGKAMIEVTHDRSDERCRCPPSLVILVCSGSRLPGRLSRTRGMTDTTDDGYSAAILSAPLLGNRPFRCYQAAMGGAA